MVKAAPAVFVGIDLAWGARRPSGVALLGEHGGLLQELVPAQLWGTDEDICHAIAEQDSGHTLVIAVDAPLVVPNDAGERPVETEMRRRFARYHAACHPANRRLLGEPPRGERLCARLAQTLQVQLVPAPLLREDCRVVFEVYPHAAMVRLFQLPRVLEYKARRGRSLADRREQMQTYIHLLHRLPAPPLTPPPWLCNIPHAPAELKRFEDKVDALFCAWLAAHAWRYGGEVLGEASTGTIWLPALHTLQQ